MKYSAKNKLISAVVVSFACLQLSVGRPLADDLEKEHRTLGRAAFACSFYAAGSIAKHFSQDAATIAIAAYDACPSQWGEYQSISKRISRNRNSVEHKESDQMLRDMAIKTIAGEIMEFQVDNPRSPPLKLIAFLYAEAIRLELLKE